MKSQLVLSHVRFRHYDTIDFEMRILAFCRLSPLSIRRLLCVLRGEKSSGYTYSQTLMQSLRHLVDKGFLQRVYVGSFNLCGVRKQLRRPRYRYQTTLKGQQVCHAYFVVFCPLYGADVGLLGVVDGVVDGWVGGLQKGLKEVVREVGL